MSTTIKKTLQVLGLTAAVFITASLFVWLASSQKAYGSVSISNEYNATTTASNANAYGNLITASTQIATSSLTFGSVVITGANTGVLNFYDATTSAVTSRKLASSSILIASIPASAAAGTYTFDVRLNDGLYVEMEGGIMPTTTITWRR